MQRFDIGAMLQELDPDMAEAFRANLRLLIDDCKTRPTVDAARTMTIDIEVTPSHNPKSGQVDGVRVKPKLKSPKVPTQQRAKGYELLMETGPEGTDLFYNQFNTDDARQGQLPFEGVGDSQAHPAPHSTGEEEEST